MDLEGSILGAQRSFNALGAQNNGNTTQKNHENLAFGAQKAPKGAIFGGKRGKTNCSSCSNEALDVDFDKLACSSQELWPIQSDNP